MGLKGLRLAFASETDEGQRFSPSKVKWYTGGDQLVGRHPHDKYEIRFTPTHTLVLLTNHKPHAPADDFAFWERIHLIPFNLSFVDREPVIKNERRAIKGMAQALKEEGPGILAWLVMGCLLYQRDGLKPPKVVTEATAAYRRSEDLLADFLDACCELGEHREAFASELYSKFTEWYRENINKNEKETPTQKRFGTLIARRFERLAGNKKIKYTGLSLKFTTNKKD
jgi:putative DNA primase/helicase